MLKLPKIKIHTLKNCQNSIFRGSNFVKNWFHVKYQWRENSEIFTLCLRTLYHSFFSYQMRMKKLHLWTITELQLVSVFCNGSVWNTKNWDQLELKVLKQKLEEVWLNFHFWGVENLFLVFTMWMLIWTLIMFGSTNGTNFWQISTSSAMKILKFRFAKIKFVKY